MAEITTRKRGEKWEYRFEAAKVDGKRKQISKGGFRTKKEALDAGIKALAEYNSSGSSFSPSEMSFADYLDYWFTNYVLVSCKYNTQRAYQQIIQDHLKPQLGSYRLKSLTAITLQEFITKKSTTGLKKSTLVNILSVLTGSLKYAVVPAQLLQYSPAEYVKLPRTTAAKSETNRTVISVEDFNRMSDRFKGTPHYYALVIGFYTGMRIGEVYGLTWDRINLKSKTITIDRIAYKRFVSSPGNKSFKEEKSAWYFGSPKTSTSTRTIRIGDTLAAALTQYRKWQLENRLKYGEYYTEHYRKEEKDEKGETIYRIVSAEKSITVALPVEDLVMRNENGTYSSIDSFKYPSRIIHHELNIQFNFHSLRHTHATMLIEAGVKPKAVQERLGHNNIETTLQTYVHNTEDMEQEAVEQFELAARKGIG